MRKLTLFFLSLAVILAGCGGTEIQIKDTYVYNPVSHLKNKYPISVAITGGYKSDKVVLKDDILEICKTELDSLKLFSEVGNKTTAGYDVVIDLTFSEIELRDKPGLELNITMKQLPDKKLIYKNKYTSVGEEESFQNSEKFAELLKNVITQFTSDIDAKFALYAKEGNLPVNRSGKDVTCAVFKFKDTVENEQYGDAVSGMMMANLTKTENVKIVERDRIQKAVSELELQTSGLADISTAKEVGKFLNADFLIFGDISKIKNTYHIVIHVVDVKLGQIVISKDLVADDPDKFDEIVQQQANYVAQFISR
jgi:TolB-like protein